MNIKKVRVIIGFKDYTKSKKFNFMDWCVSFWTKSKYIHTKVLIDNVWVQATLNGVKIEKFDPKNLNNPNYDFKNLGEIELLENQYLQLKHFISSIECAEYDWIQIFLSQFIGFGIDSARRWTCSELSTKLLQLCYVDKVLFSKSERISPKELADIFGLS